MHLLAGGLIEADREIGRLHAEHRIEVDGLRAELADCERRRVDLELQLSSMRASHSWRVTAPLRSIAGFLGRGRAR